MQTEFSEPIILTIPPELAGSRLDIALAKIIPELSRSKLNNWIKTGQIIVDNHIIKSSHKVSGKEVVIITPIFTTLSLDMCAQNIPLNIVYSDNHIIIINKQAGLVVHPGNGNLDGTLLNALLYYFPELATLPRCGIVHRLDKDTSGLMVVARNITSQVSLVRQLHQRSVSRIYQTIVCGTPAPIGTINTNIGRNKEFRIKMAVLEHGGKPAITHYKVLQYFDEFSYVQCRLETGRTHQIRVHMKHLKHPIVGDLLYGRKKPTSKLADVNELLSKFNRQALHAVELSLTHPYSQERVTFTCNLSDDMQELLNAFKVHSTQ